MRGDGGGRWQLAGCASFSSDMYREREREREREEMRARASCAHASKRCLRFADFQDFSHCHRSRHVFVCLATLVPDDRGSQ